MTAVNWLPLVDVFVVSWDFVLAQAKSPLQLKRQQFRAPGSSVVSWSGQTSEFSKLPIPLNHGEEGKGSK